MQITTHEKSADKKASHEKPTPSRGRLFMADLAWLYNINALIEIVPDIGIGINARNRYRCRPEADLQCMPAKKQ